MDEGDRECRVLHMRHVRGEQDIQAESARTNSRSTVVGFVLAVPPLSQLSASVVPDCSHISCCCRDFPDLICTLATVPDH